MRVFVGQTRSRELIDKLDVLGIGEMTVRGEFPPRRNPWVFDNGVFRDWRAGTRFDRTAFRESIEKIRASPARPDFIVAPDIIAGGKLSLLASCTWAKWLREVAPVFVAVQDGMNCQMVGELMHLFDGIFVGGTLDWKVQTGEQWAIFAHAIGKGCHIGRMGTPKRVRWARRIEERINAMMGDGSRWELSIDSALPLWSRENLARFVNALTEDEQEEFLLGVGT